jgi:hypothetical protein
MARFVPWVRWMPWAQALGASVVAALAAQAIGCGTDPVATEACRRIEQARCRKAAACPELGLQGEVGVEECTQFARDRCLHGLAVEDPGPAAVDRCVSAIEQDCAAAGAPETSPECSFLRATPPTEDGGPDAAPDGISEAGQDSIVGL